MFKIFKLYAYSSGEAFETFYKVLDRNHILYDMRQINADTNLWRIDARLGVLEALKVKFQLRKEGIEI